jgi:hypothetical protein
MTRHVVLAGARATVADGAERLLQLATLLQRSGCTVEILVLGDGELLEDLRKAAPTTVVDEFRRRGPGMVPTLLGMQRGARAAKGWRLRRWMASRASASFLIFHPTAAAVLRFAPARPAAVVAALPDHRWTLDRLDPDDLAVLRDAAAWVTSDGTQTAHVAATLGRPVFEFGALVDPSTLPRLQGPRPGAGAIVLVTADDLWDEPDHAPEIAWKLQRALPDHPLRVVTSGPSNAWLADHDLAHAGVSASVQRLDVADAAAVEDIGLVVRTGYGPASSPLVLAAAMAAVPVVGFCVADLPGVGGDAAPFDVDGVVHRAATLAADPELAAAEGHRQAAAVAHLNVEAFVRQLRRALLVETP